MRIVMDSDCLIKLTKARLKESVCRAYEITIPVEVRREVVDQSKGHPESIVVEDREHLDGSAAIRKLIRTGLENYVASLYRQGAITLREASNRLGLNLVETLDRLADHGVKGNLEAADVLASVERFSGS